MEDWKMISDRKVEILRTALSGLSEGERKVFVGLVKLEIEQRNLTAPRVRVPLKELVALHVTKGAR